MSHEFIIQNHADIFSSVCMIFVIGLMVQATSPFATMFIVPQHTVNNTGTSLENPLLYTNGRQDIALIFFYSLIAVVLHAIVQEYVIDKITKKLHLSKSKNSKFNESGQIAVFALVSAIWGVMNIMKDEKITSLSSLWLGYPESHTEMSFRTKFFFIGQIAYWLHSYPELYLQKVKKEDMAPIIIYSTVHLIMVSLAYAFNLTRLGMVLLVLHFTCEAMLHFTKLFHFAQLEAYSQIGFAGYNQLFAVVRLLSLILANVTILFGLGNSTNQQLDFATGNFNVAPIRTVCLVAVCGVQAWMLWSFVTFHLAKKRQREAMTSHKISSATMPSKKGGKGARQSDEDEALLPEVDQNTRRRNRSKI